MKYVSCCLEISPAAGGWRELVPASSSPEGKTRSNSAWVFNGTSLICISLVMVSICVVTAGSAGHLAEAACASSSSRCSISMRRVALRVPTLGAGFCCARHCPRPLLLPGFTTAGGVSGTTSMSIAFSGVLMSARGGVTGGVISSVVCRWISSVAGCADGGAEEALGRGISSAGLGREVIVRGSARGVECCCSSSGMRCIVGGSSLI